MPQGPQAPLTGKTGMDAVAKAAAQLASSEKKFPSSMAKAAGATVPPKATPSANKASAPAKPAVDTTNLTQELKDKRDNVKQYKDNTPAPQYHKGGKIKKDGVQTIDAKKGETVLPTKDKKHATELAMKHLDGMKEGMEHKAKKHESKHESKPEHKKHGKVKKMHVHVNDDNTFSMTHEHNPSEDGSQMPDTTHSAPDMDGLMDHMQEHLGTPNPGEAEANAGPAAPAAGAPAPVAA